MMMTINTTIITDDELMEEAFAEILISLGFEAWYEAEEIWDEVEEILLDMGFDSDMVGEFFSEMAWEL